MFIKLTEKATDPNIAPVPVFIAAEQMHFMIRVESEGYTNVGIVGESLSITETPEEILAIIRASAIEPDFKEEHLPITNMVATAILNQLKTLKFTHHTEGFDYTMWDDVVGVCGQYISAGKDEQ